MKGYYNTLRSDRLIEQPQTVCLKLKLSHFKVKNNSIKEI